MSHRAHPTGICLQHLPCQSRNQTAISCVVLNKDCFVAQGLAPTLLPYLRLAHAGTQEEVDAAVPGLLDAERAGPISPSNEREALHQLDQYLHARLDKCVLNAQLPVL